MAARPKKRVQVTDLAPRSSVVATSVGEVVVHKLGAGELVSLFLTYPSLRTIGSGKLNVAQLADDCPEAIPEIISRGLGIGDEGINGVRALDPCDQLLILIEIVEVTFPEGVKSFLERLGTLMAVLQKKAQSPTP